MMIRGDKQLLTVFCSFSILYEYISNMWMDIILPNSLVKVDIYACQVVKIQVEIIVFHISYGYIIIHVISVIQCNRETRTSVHVQKIFLIDWLIFCKMIILFSITIYKKKVSIIHFMLSFSHNLFLFEWEKQGFFLHFNSMFNK